MIGEVPFDSKKLKLHHLFESIDTDYIVKLEEIDVFLTLSGEGGGRVQRRGKRRGYISNISQHSPGVNALFALVFPAVVVTDARSAALFALASFGVVISDVRSSALFSPAFFTVVVADARSAAFLAQVFHTVVVADNAA